MYHKLILECFERFKVYYKNKEIKFGNLEDVINKQISEAKKENNIFIMPKDNDYLLITQIIYHSLNYCLHNIFESNEDILDVIKVGDTVEYNKALACFAGVENEWIVLEFKDGTIKFPLSLRYKVSKYNGNATILNKMPNKSISGWKKTKNLLSEILNIEEFEMCKAIKKSMLIVGSKDNINEIVKSLEIKVGEQPKVPISEVFTMAYYSSKENCYFYKGNSKKEEPMIKFTSKTYIAKELVKANKKINSILFLPKKVINADLVDLIQIFRRKSIGSIDTIVNHIDIERRMNDDFMKNGFKITEMKFDELNNVEYFNAFNKKQLDLINNYKNGIVNYNLIKDFLITKSRKQMNKACRILLNSFQDDNDIIKYVISARKICKVLTSLLIPLSEYERITRRFRKNNLTIEYCNNDLLNQSAQLKKRNLSNDMLTNIEVILQCIQNIYYEINKSNLKWDKFNEIIKHLSGYRNSLIIENKHMRDVVKFYIKEKFPNKYNLIVEDSNSNRGNFYCMTLIGGILNENLYWNYKRCNSNKVIILGYEYENQYYKLSYKGYLNFMKDNIEIDLEERSNDINDNTLDDTNIAVDLHLENEIESLIAMRYIPDIKSSSNPFQEQTKCEAVITFTNGRKAFITPQYNAYVINENKEELVQKKLKELQIGDILVFIEGIEKDLIDTIIQQLMSLKEIKEAYEEDYSLSKKWKVILKEYSEINRFTLKDLSEKLKLYGVNRESATIRSWMVDAIVGPQEEEVYKAIGNLTESEFLINNYKKVYEACNNIRRLQIRVRKAIVRSLLKDSLLDSVDSIDELIRKNINDKINYVHQVEIQRIYKVDKEIPIYITNKILEV